VSEASREPWHRRLAGGLPPAVRRRLLRFEADIERQVELFAGELPDSARVLDAGAGEGKHASYFARCRYVAVDLAIGETAWDYSRLDTVADLARLPFADATFDAALNIVVLEHLPEPWRALGEIGRVLRPGAPLLVAAPQEWGVHQAPHDYFRYTRHGLQRLLEQAGFCQIAIEPAGGFFVLLGRRFLDAVLYFQGGLRWLLFPLVAVFAGAAGLLLPFLDFLDSKKDSTLGYLCRARKR
jgi:SAM-dependent methyltransferase